MFKFILITAIFIVHLPLYAAMQEEKSFLDQYTPLHTKLTNDYYHLLKKIDNTFCETADINNTKLEKIIYKSRLQIITSLQHDEQHALMPYLYIRANIILPKTNKRFEITLDKQTDSKVQNQKIDENYNSALMDEKVHIGLKYNLVKKDSLNFYAKLGARLNKLTDPYAKVGAVRHLNFSSFIFFADAQVYKYLFNEKIIASTSINFIKPIDNYFIFENNNILTWYKDQKETDWDTIFKLYQYIDKKQSLEYWLSYTAADDALGYYAPKEYNLHLKYRYMLKRWAYVEFAPQLLKKKENHFKIEKEISLNFGIIFSK